MRAARFVVVLGLVGCHTYRDQLARADAAYQRKDDDRVISLLRDLEKDFHSLEPAEKADYAWTRGMADYDIGYQNDAHHWLSVAKAYDDATPGSLTADQKAKANAALADLNKVVFSDGAGALTQTRKDAPPPPPPPAPKPPKPKANPEEPPPSSGAEDPTN